MKIKYIIRKSKKAQGLSLSVNQDKKIVLIVPKNISLSVAKVFLQEKKAWIEKTLQKVESRKKLAPQAGNAGDFKNNKEKARQLVKAKLAQFNQSLNYKYNRVAIRNQKTRWGSCSQHKNLNFNYQIFYLPEALANYLIVHELCHLQEMNHSPRYWSLVAELVPDYKKRRKELKKYSL